jgi:CO/xanthine dehydrogenase Mo-binding subunit
MAKLVGQNYVTPDLVAKVTGRAKYAEDFRAEGMLFVKLLLSPMPHARVTRLDTSAALAMPGVKAILTAEELPPPADIVTDLGFTIPANRRGEQALTNEPLYEGEPILAVAAVDEQTAAEAVERIQIELEPLPFVVDPLESLRPGGPTARQEGNIWYRPAAPPPAPGAKPGPPPPIEVRDLKWTEEQFADFASGKLPMGEVTDEWSYGDLEAGFKDAALVLDETYVTPNTSHQTMEPRSAMAYWQNGKLYMHCATQSTVQTVMSVARWLQIPPEDVVLISEYTGGGFGSKIPGAQSMAIPALLSKKLNGRPVMMRISREEETYIGRTRPGFQAWAKMGFKKDGRVTAIDAFIIEDSGPYRRQGDCAQAVNLATLLYQAPHARFRGLSVATNTPPRVSQRAPGGLQSSILFEPLVNKAARELGLDQVAIRKINAPVNGSSFGLNPPAQPNRPRPRVTSSYVREALDRGAELFGWEERKQRSGQRKGSKVTGLAVSCSSFTAGSTGVDGLFVIKPDGKMYIHQGVGNLGTHSVHDTARVAAEVMDFPWDDVVVVWGNTGQGVAWSSIQAGSQTTHAHTRANHAAGMAGKRLAQELAAAELGGSPGAYRVGGRGVAGPGGSLTWAQLAERAIKRGGRFDGHEPPADINAMTKASAALLAGQGLVAAGRDSYPRDGQTYSFVAGFVEVEVDVETGVYRIVDYLAVADVGTVLHPRSLGGQILGGGIQGMGAVVSQKMVYDAHYGVAIGKRMHHNRPPTMLDIPIDAKWDALNIPDPGNPVVGAKGIGEPGIGVGASSVLCALANALGNDDVLKRTPVQPEHIMMAVREGRIAYEPLTAYI